MRNLALLMKLWRLWPSANTAMLDEITRNFESELDYLREAGTQHVVAEQYRGHPFIVVPDSVVTSWMEQADRHDPDALLARLP